MNEGARVYFRSVYLILSNLQINVYVNFSLCQMKLLFAALYITWKYLINDKWFQEGGINKQAKFQDNICTTKDSLEGVRLQNGREALT